MAYNITNGTNKVIKFRLVIENSDLASMRSKGAITLQPGESTTVGSLLIRLDGGLGLAPKYHIDIDIDNWPENAAWKDLANKTKNPKDDWQNPNSTYWGIGEARGWGVTFHGNPRGTFRMKGPSTKYPPFYDPNQYLTLSE